MADDETGKPNGALKIQIGEDRGEPQQELTLFAVLNGLIGEILLSDPNSSTTLLQRFKTAISVNAPLLPEASKITGKNVLAWAQRGSPLRSLLVVSVGTVALLALSGIFIFALFFLAATFNAIIISLIISLAAAGGFLAIFFAFVAAIYVCTLSIAGFVISTATISAIIASLVVAGWVVFFYTLWLVANKSFCIAKRSVAVTGSAVTAFSSALHGHHQPCASKKSD